MGSEQPARRTPGHRHLAGLPVAGVECDGRRLIAVTVDGTRWPVIAEPSRWYERVRWWQDSWAPREVPAVEVLVLRVQGRRGGSGSQIVTFDLARDRTGGYRVTTVDGQALAPSPGP